MTPEEQRIEIAKACGWTKFTPHTIQFCARRADGKWGMIPDYTNDLNAMNEAEKVLPENRLEIYASWLRDGNASGASPAELYHWHATSAQRAESFLKTLNLWKP
jgi:hypothetical protein